MSGNSVNVSVSGFGMNMQKWDTSRNTTGMRDQGYLGEKHFMDRLGRKREEGEKKDLKVSSRARSFAGRRSPEHLGD